MTKCVAHMYLMIFQFKMLFSGGGAGVVGSHLILAAMWLRGMETSGEGESVFRRTSAS